MKRHDVRRVVLLGVGGVQKDDPARKALIEKWMRRVLGELPSSVANQVAYRNAVRLYRAE
jgi:hypothetical protein